MSADHPCTAPCAAVEPLHSAWLDGQLQPHEHEQVTRHLQRCGACRAAVDGLDRTRTLLAAAPVRALPPTLAHALRTAEPVREAAAGDAEAGAGPVAGSGPGAWRVATAAVGALSILGAAAFALGGSPPPPAREVAVPVDLFVADHVVRSVAGPVTTPVLVER